jgi:uncharacterized ferredoxin-like protein
MDAIGRPLMVTSLLAVVQNDGLVTDNVGTCGWRTCESSTARSRPA